MIDGISFAGMSLEAWIYGIGFALSFSAAMTLWDMGCELEPSRRILRFLFRGKIRSIMTSEVVNAIFTTIACLVCPQTASDTAVLGVAWGVFVLGLVAPFMFMNLRLGPYSQAPKDRQRSHLIITEYKDGILSDSTLSRRIGCILREALAGNRASARILRTLAERTDELGVRVRQTLIGLSTDIRLTSTVLGCDLVLPDPRHISSESQDTTS